MFDVLNAKLAEHQAKNLVRVRKIISKAVTSFSSNDYLSLSGHPKIVSAFKRGADLYGVGSGSSQHIVGYTLAHQAFEEAFAEFVARDKAILFGNGYLANLGVLSALAQVSDVIYQDKFNHASLIDAGKLADGKSKRFAHLDLEHLSNLIKKQSCGNKFIVTDSVFSMTGEIAKLSQLATIATTHQAYLIVDDAHGVGILGEHGRGVCEYFSLDQNQVPVLISPLGKAFGGYGALVSGNKILIEYLLQFARTGIFTTAIPAALACAGTASLQIVKNESWRRDKLNNLIQGFKNLAIEMNLNFLPSDTPIQSIMFGDNQQVLEIQEFLEKKGFLVAAIRPPTVPQNGARLRISLCCSHELYQIEQLLSEIAKWLTENPSNKIL